jgi:hypothetical protein
MCIKHAHRAKNYTREGEEERERDSKKSPKE